MGWEVVGGVRGIEVNKGEGVFGWVVLFVLIVGLRRLFGG